MSGIFPLGGLEDNTALAMVGNNREEQVGVGGGGADAHRISIAACCCYHGYSDMEANCRCQADNSEDQLETLGVGR